MSRSLYKNNNLAGCPHNGKLNLPRDGGKSRWPIEAKKGVALFSALHHDMCYLSQTLTCFLHLTHHSSCMLQCTLAMHKWCKTMLMVYEIVS